MKHRIPAKPPLKRQQSTKTTLTSISTASDVANLVHFKQWKHLSPAEAAIIHSALSQADKLRLAAWDPGAAYLSGVLDVLTEMRIATTNKLKQLTGDDPE